MTSHSRGFTLVEMVLVTAALGILASIAVVAWGGVATWSREQARESDLNQWVTTFDLYKSRFKVWPVMPANDATPSWVCLGKPTTTPTSNPDKCVRYTGAATAYISNTSGTQGANYTTLETQVRKIGNMPTNGGPDVKSLYRGPFFYVRQSTNSVSGDVTVTGKFVNFFENSCPSGTTRVTTSPTAPAPYTTLLLGVPSSVYVCEVTPNKTFTYNPMS